MTQDMLTISVVDQSPMRRGGSAADALRESVRLAQIAERLGYRRYWVAEHHNATSYACTSPELLTAQIAAHTRTIRVGSGGVMLSNYSALKVAEQFRVLQAFYPGRIDLGIGRAAGGDPTAARALAHPRPPVERQEFPGQVIDLLNFLHGTPAADHPYANVQAQPGPAPDDCPEVWLLGSSVASAQFAAELGLPFAFADFLGAAREGGPAAAAHYRQSFQPSRWGTRPRFSVAVEVLCAATTEEARFLALSRNFDRIAEAYGIQGFLPPQQVLEYSITEELRRFMEEWTKSCIDGDPEQVRARLLELAQLYGTSDLSIVTNCYDFAARVRSYELLAEAFHLRRATEPCPAQPQQPGASLSTNQPGSTSKERD